MYICRKTMLDWFEQNSGKAKKLPEHLQELLKLQYYDNQVVVIDKMKK